MMKLPPVSTNNTLKEPKKEIKSKIKKTFHLKYLDEKSFISRSLAALLVSGLREEATSRCQE